MRIVWGVFLVVAVAAAGCGDDDGGGAIDATVSIDGSGGSDAVATVDATLPSADGAPHVFFFSGTVTGPSAAAGPVAVIWIVETGNYGYSYGDGTSVGATFSGGLPGDPPAAARMMFPQLDLGIAPLILMSPGQSLPEGMYPDFPPFVGVSARHALIFRGPTDTGAQIPWTAAFPFGLSCGVCVDSAMGFDSYMPVDCATMVIDTDPAADFCNWT